MQFYQNGFYPGDPFVAPLAAEPAKSDSVASEVDVLIVGCGPTGLTLAAQLSAFPEIRTAIVEQKDGPLLIGQADGIACRSVEMYEAFGFAEKVLKEGYWVNETSFWKPDETKRDCIARSGRIQDTEDGLSEFPHLILNQARIHDFLLEVMRNSPSRLEPGYARKLASLKIDRAAEYPVTVTLERLDEAHRGEIETVRARYVIGCDGARSSVRTAIGRELKGDSANQGWGVMDVLAVTDFPDIRLKAAIHSANEGNILIIPREGGYMVRLYIELDKLSDNERISHRNVTSGDLVAAAQRILHPYTLDVKEVAWWSVYEIGQRICDKYDDVPAGKESEQFPCVFIAGDACHTHSPKAGQGMNVSIADGFNLGWKLASVLQGRAGPDLLHSYSSERRAIAQELIDFDREFARMFSAPPRDANDPESEGVDPAEFQKYFVKHGRFTAGTSVHYRPSAIVGDGANQHLAEGFTIGMRFHSAPVVRLGDAKPLHLGHVVKADGRWRLFAFAPAEDPAAEGSALNRLCDFLAHDPASPIRRHTPAGADIDSVIELLAVLQQAHRDLAIEHMHPLLVPAKGRYGLRDYEKIFCPNLKDGPDIFDLRGIDRRKGCLVLVRPDQFVAEVLPFEAHGELAAFLEGVLLPA